MTEFTDVLHVILERYSILQWIRDFLRTKSFTVWDIKDPLPSVYKYIQFVKVAIQRGVKRIFHRMENN